MDDGIVDNESKLLDMDGDLRELGQSGSSEEDEEYYMDNQQQLLDLIQKKH